MCLNIIDYYISTIDIYVAISSSTISTNMFLHCRKLKGDNYIIKSGACICAKLNETISYKCEPLFLDDDNVDDEEEEVLNFILEIINDSDKNTQLIRNITSA